MKTSKCKKPKTYWAWKNKDGVILPLFSTSLKDAKFCTLPLYTVKDWRTAYADGWRIVKVKIVEVKS